MCYAQSEKFTVLLVFERGLNHLEELAVRCIIWDAARSCCCRCSAAHANVFFFVFAECQSGFFKAEASGGKCEPCPANTQWLDSGALSCPCMDGFYRAPTDPPAGPCSGENYDLSKVKMLAFKELLSDATYMTSLVFT